MGLILHWLLRRMHAENGLGHRSDRIWGDGVNRSNLRKPILTRGPVGALRYAWLRAPPFRRAKPDPDLSEVLTHKSPYEGGQRRSCAVPTIFAVRWARPRAHARPVPLPTLRLATTSSHRPPRPRSAPASPAPGDS